MSDYQKGVLGEKVVQACIAMMKPGQPITGNLKPAAFAALGKPYGISVLTINLHEASLAVGVAALAEGQLINAGVQILRNTASTHVLISRDHTGLRYSRRIVRNILSMYHLVRLKFTIRQARAIL